jgi:predicted Zn-dependent peptidase
VITKRLENFSSAAFGYWVEAGSVRELESNSGVSHFLEHMAFKGTTSRSARQIAEEIEAIGGYLNAYTSKEVTAFHAKVLSENSPTAVDVLSDILQNPAFLPKELERERMVVLQEISQIQDSPEDLIFDYFDESAFPRQPLGRPILGSADVIAKIDADALRRYREEYYNAGNIIFAAVGDVCHEELLAAAQKHLLNFPKRETPTYDIKCDYVGGARSDVRDLEQAYIIIGFNGLTSLDPDYYAMSLFSSILGGGMSSRLFQEVREKRGLVYSIYSFTSSHKHNGSFGIYAATSPSKLKELTDVAANEMLKMRKNVSEKELRRAKAQFKSGLLMSNESNTSCCERVVHQTLLFGRPLEYEEMLEKLEAVTLDDLMTMTDRVLASQASVVTVGKCDAAPAIASLCSNGIKCPDDGG